jgi:hypothetical protein
MAHELAESDRSTEGILRMKIREVFRDRCVKVKLTALKQLHDRNVGEELGN